MQKIHKTTTTIPYGQKTLSKPPNNFKRIPSSSKTIDNPSPKASKNLTNTQAQYREITPAELTYRREKGLCFKCAKPYTLGHMCKQSHVHYIISEEGENEAENEEKRDEKFTAIVCVLSW